jgi:hypothetical protein
MVPLLGWLFGMVLSILALGLVLVTRFGAEPAPGAAPATATAGPAAPPPAPVTPPPAVPAVGEPPRAW